MAKSARISLLVVIVAVAGACSSSYNGLSKAEFVKQASAICAASNKKFDAVSSTVGHDTSLAALQKLYREQFAPTARSEIEQLRALKPPKADRATISKMLDDLSSGVESLVASVAAVKTTPELLRLKSPASVAAATNAAKAYGLTGCGDTGN